MVTDHVLPDLLERSGERARDRVALAEDVGHVGVRSRGDDRPPCRRAGRTRRSRSSPAGIEGLYVRLTAKAATEAEARALIEAEEAELRPIIGELVFAVDDETMESVVLDACAATRVVARRRRVAHRRPRRRAARERAGASRTFRGSIASYATRGEASAARRHRRVGRERRRRRSRWPTAHAARSAATSRSRSPVSPVPTSRTASRSGPCGSGSRCPVTPTEAVSTRLPGDRERIRQFSTISGLNLLRMRLASLRVMRDRPRVRRGRASRQRPRRGRGRASSGAAADAGPRLRWAARSVGT